MDTEGAAVGGTKYSRFHSCHGSNIALGNEGRTAWRKKGEFRKALVFSEGPMPVGNVFQLKILSNMGDLRIGITSCDPFYSQPLPTDASQTYDSPNYWVLSGEVIHHRAYEKRMNFSIADLLVGDIIGCSVTKKGRLEYFVNGKKKGIGWGGLPIDKPLWGFADLHGKTDYVESQFICAEQVGRQGELQTSQEVKSDSETKDTHLQNETQSLPSSRMRTPSLDPALHSHHTGGFDVRGRSQTVTASMKMGAVQGSAKSDGSNKDELKVIRRQLQDILGPSASGMGDSRAAEREEEGGADISSLLSALKVRMTADREEMQWMERENDVALDKRDKRIKELESSVVTYQVAVAQMEQEQQSLRTKYAALSEELQSHVSSFQDRVRETQSELEGVRGGFADMKRIVEVHRQTSERVQECTDEVRHKAVVDMKKEMETCLGEKRQEESMVDGLTEEKVRATDQLQDSGQHVKEQKCEFVLDTEPVVDSGKPG